MAALPVRKPDSYLAAQRRGCNGGRHPVAGSLPGEATWRSGDAADCKSVYAGSIPAVASILMCDVQYVFKRCTRSKTLTGHRDGRAISIVGKRISGLRAVAASATMIARLFGVA